jgi:plastocyanin
MTRLWPTAIAIAALAAVSGCGGGSGGSATGSTASAGSTARGGGTETAASRSGVEISNFKFVPATITVSAGAHLAVANDDTTAHTATADDGSFDTGDISPGSTSTIDLSKPGRIAYHCSIHPFMHGTIVVR